MPCRRQGCGFFSLRAPFGSDLAVGDWMCLLESRARNGALGSYVDGFERMVADPEAIMASSD